MNSLSKPWLVNYLSDCLNSYGFNIDSPSIQRRVVQIIRFLTGPTVNDPEPSTYWVEISDSDSYISAQISAKAASKFHESRGHRLSAIQSGVFLISYHSAIASDALGSGCPVELRSSLILIITELELLGSEGEPTFGSPSLAVSHPVIRDRFFAREQNRDSLGPVSLLKGDSGALTIREDAKTSFGLPLTFPQWDSLKPLWNDSDCEFFMDNVRPPIVTIESLCNIWNIPNEVRTIPTHLGKSFKQELSDSERRNSRSTITTSSSPENFYSDWVTTPRSIGSELIDLEVGHGSPKTLHTRQMLATSDDGVSDSSPSWEIDLGVPHKSTAEDEDGTSSPTSVDVASPSHDQNSDRRNSDLPRRIRQHDVSSVCTAPKKWTSASVLSRHQRLQADHNRMKRHGGQVNQSTDQRNYAESVPIVESTSNGPGRSSMHRTLNDPYQLEDTIHSNKHITQVPETARQNDVEPESIRANEMSSRGCRSPRLQIYGESRVDNERRQEAKRISWLDIRRQAIGYQHLLLTTVAINIVSDST